MSRLTVEATVAVPCARNFRLAGITARSPRVRCLAREHANSIAPSPLGTKLLAAMKYRRLCLIALLALAAPPASRAQLPSRTFIDESDRVEVQLASDTVRLAEPVQISLRIHGGPWLKELTGHQSQVSYGVKLNITGSNAVLPIALRSDGTIAATILPLRLGPITLHLFGGLSDGGYFKKDIPLNVKPTTMLAHSMTVGHAGEPKWMHAGFSWGSARDFATH